MMGCCTRARLASEESQVLPCVLLFLLCYFVGCPSSLTRPGLVAWLLNKHGGLLLSFRRPLCFRLNMPAFTAARTGDCRAIAGGSRTRSVVHRIALYSRQMHISHIISQSDIARYASLLFCIASYCFQNIQCKDRIKRNACSGVPLMMKALAHCACMRAVTLGEKSGIGLLLLT